jgi:hypothetical protein
MLQRLDVFHAMQAGPESQSLFRQGGAENG